jgi:hypothetical protein
MAGHREGSMYNSNTLFQRLRRFWGAMLGLLSVAAYLSGAIGSGTRISMAVTIIHGCEFSFIRFFFRFLVALGEVFWCRGWVVRKRNGGHDGWSSLRDLAFTRPRPCLALSPRPWARCRRGEGRSADIYFFILSQL